MAKLLTLFLCLQASMVFGQNSGDKTELKKLKPREQVFIGPLPMPELKKITPTNPLIYIGEPGYVAPQGDDSAASDIDPNSEVKLNMDKMPYVWDYNSESQDNGVFVLEEERYGYNDLSEAEVAENRDPEFPIPAVAKNGESCHYTPADSEIFNPESCGPFYSVPQQMDEQITDIADILIAENTTVYQDRNKRDCILCYEHLFDKIDGEVDGASAGTLSRLKDTYEEVYKNQAKGLAIEEAYRALDKYNESMLSFYGVFAKQLDGTSPKLERKDLFCNDVAEIKSRIFGNGEGQQHPTCAERKAFLASNNKGMAEFTADIEHFQNLTMESLFFKKKHDSFEDSLKYYMNNFDKNYVNPSLSCSNRMRHAQFKASQFYRAQSVLGPLEDPPRLITPSEASFSVLDVAFQNNNNGDRKELEEIKESYCADNSTDERTPRDLILSRLFPKKSDDSPVNKLLSDRKNSKVKNDLEAIGLATIKADKDNLRIVKGLLDHSMMLEPTLGLLLVDKKSFCGHFLAKKIAQQSHSAKNIVMHRDKAGKSDLASLRPILDNAKNNCSRLYDNLAKNFCATSLEDLTVSPHVLAKAGDKVSEEDIKVKNQSAYTEFMEGENGSRYKNLMEQSMQCSFIDSQNHAQQLENNFFDVNADINHRIEIVADNENRGKDAITLESQLRYDRFASTFNKSGDKCYAGRGQAIGTTFVRGFHNVYFPRTTGNLLDPNMGGYYISKAGMNSKAILDNPLFYAGNTSLDETGVVYGGGASSGSEGGVNYARTSDGGLHASLMTRTIASAGTGVLNKDETMYSLAKKTVSASTPGIFSGEPASGGLTTDEADGAGADNFATFTQNYLEEQNRLNQAQSMFDESVNGFRQTQLLPEDISQAIEEDMDMAKKFTDLKDDVSRKLGMSDEGAYNALTNSLAGADNGELQSQLAGSANEDLRQEIADLRKQIEKFNRKDDAENMSDSTKNLIDKLNARIKDLEGQVRPASVAKSNIGVRSGAGRSISSVGGDQSTGQASYQSLGGLRGGSPGQFEAPSVQLNDGNPNVFNKEVAIGNIMRNAGNFIDDNNFNLSYDTDKNKLFLEVSSEDLDINDPINLEDIILNRENGKVQAIVFDRSIGAIPVSNLPEQSQAAINSFVQQNGSSLSNVRKADIEELKQQVKKLKVIQKQAKAVVEDPDDESAYAQLIGATVCQEYPNDPLCTK